MRNLPPLIFPPLHRVASRPRPGSKIFSLVGAGVGVVLFLAVAVVLSLVYGVVAAFVLLGIMAAVSIVVALFAAPGSVGGASIEVRPRATMVRRA